MKKSSSTGEGALGAPRRFNGWGILAASVGLATLIFLVIGPMIERNSHLEALEDLEDQQRLKRGLLMLCNTEANTIYLNTQLEQKSLEERNQVTRVARTLDCIDRLGPVLQAEYYLWNGEPEDVPRVVAQGAAAVEPAIEALESEQEEVRARAARALVAMADELNDDRRLRIARRLSDEDRSAPVVALRALLGLPDPATVLPVEEPIEQESPPQVIDMGALPEPDAAGDMAEVGVSEDMDGVDAGDLGDEPMSEEDMSSSDMEVDFPASPAGMFKLREPTLELKSPRVLYPRTP